MNKDEMTMQLKEQTTFEPRRRIAISVDKLSGKNPVLVLHKELGRNRNVVGSLDKLKGFLSRAASRATALKNDVDNDDKKMEEEVVEEEQDFFFSGKDWKCVTYFVVVYIYAALFEDMKYVIHKHIHE